MAANMFKSIVGSTGEGGRGREEGGEGREGWEGREGRRGREGVNERVGEDTDREPTDLGL